MTSIKGEAAICSARLLLVYRQVGAHMRAQQDDPVVFEPTISQHLRLSTCRLYHFISEQSKSLRCV